MGAPTDDRSSEASTPSELALAEENARLRKVCQALIERVESSGVAGGAPYAAFEHAVLLAEQVRERTETLHRTLDELSQANEELGQLNTKLREEIDERLAAEQGLRDAKAEAEAANLSKTKFLAAVSHDLLQPLNAARLFTSALAEHDMPAASQALVGHIGRSLKDVEGLLGTLVDISRLDAGVLKPDVATFPVSELLDMLAEEYRQVAVAQGLSLHYVPSSAVVHSDLQLLARVVRNFLTNALRYTRQGRVTLGCRRRKQGLEIVVADTGPGIADDQREAIFLEFRRANSHTDTRDRGLGLGLAIVDRIATMLDHPLRLRSRPEQGSAFSILVPYGKQQPHALPPQDAIASGALLTGMHIWVIDDDPAICEGMTALLSGWGADVSGAASLDRLEVVNDRDVDMLIIDYHLAEGEPDGLAVARSMRQQRPDLPVLVITANHDAELKRRARDLGFTCLLKPVKPLRLKMLLVNMLDDLQGRSD
ncbi:Signal transduction histidine kinase [Aidingimonas halophila]|uniref:histidine kinase n=1 Tax=Aidingimonas halophila TaxID=574349 RepID=A0A1H2SHQ4_9GAMM|nr:hypothetical protein GCM10008094_04190 [Aidingimonas halophila]SDW30704.1 Signal transduction histidine kinase [Aidingimonas halophila]